MDVFKLTQTGPEQACRAPFNVQFLTENKPTLKEFINFIQSSRPDQFGTIRIYDGSDKHSDDPLRLGEKPLLEIDFNCGKLYALPGKQDLIDKIKQETVKKAHADGGWGVMDFFIDI